MLNKYRAYITVNDYNYLLIYESVARHFHTFEHLLSMFEWLDANVHNCGFTESEINCLYIATWYHDIIYDPKSKTNEIDSVHEFTKSETFNLLNPIDVAIVKGLILATRSHKMTGNKLHNYFVRADLNMLISHKTEEVAIRMEKQIRAEYEHVNEFIFTVFRMRVLTKLNKQVTLDIKENLKYLRNRLLIILKLKK